MATKSTKSKPARRNLATRSAPIKSTRSAKAKPKPRRPKALTPTPAAVPTETPTNSAEAPASVPATNDPASPAAAYGQPQPATGQAIDVQA